MTLSKYEIKLLNYLHSNSRAPISRISKDLSINREVIKYNLKKLSDKGVIRNFITRIDLSKFAMGTLNMSLKLNRSEVKYEKLIQFLKNHNSINWIAELSGNYDISFTIIYDSFENLNKTLFEIYDLFGENIEKQSVLSFIDEMKFERSDLIAIGLNESKIKDRSINFSKKKELITLNTDEKIILNELSMNSRAKIIDISKKTSISEDMVRLKIKELEKRNIIINYTISMDTSFLKHQTYMLRLNLTNFSNKNSKKLINLVNSTKNIIFASKTLGESNILFVNSFSSSEEFNNFLINVRSLFSKNLSNYSFDLILNVLKETQIPNNYFLIE